MSEGPRPTVTLKIATSLDGRIATASGESKWITGEAAREEVHRLRAAHDAVLVGSQTVIDDDPELTVRLPGYTGPQPLRVVADARRRVTKKARLFKPSVPGMTEVMIIGRDEVEWTSQTLLPSGDRLHGGSGMFRESILEVGKAATGEGVDPGRMLYWIAPHIAARRAAFEDISRWEEAGRPEVSPPGRSEIDPKHAENIRVLLEGGGKLAGSFTRAGLIDRIEWFRAPIILGGDGRPALAALELAKLADAPRFKRLDVRAVGDDLWERYERQ